MPLVNDILRHKGSEVYTIAVSATVLQATQLMNRHRIGALVVVDQDRVAGMFTERDVLARVVAEERPPCRTSVAEVMSTDVIVVHPDTDLDDASRIMKDRRVRHLPVVDGDGRLVGLVSIGDINALHASDQQATIHFLHDYIYGRV